MNRLLTLPDLAALDQAALKAIIFAQRDQLRVRDEKLFSHESEIEHLKLMVEKLRRMLFGARSEKTARQLEQLELRLEELECAAAHERRSIPQAACEAAEPARRPLPEHLSREVHIHKPDHDACPDCGGVAPRVG